jgi:hypothetical protein
MKPVAEAISPLKQNVRLCQTIPVALENHRRHDNTCICHLVFMAVISETSQLLNVNAPGQHIKTAV